MIEKIKNSENKRKNPRSLSDEEVLNYITFLNGWTIIIIKNLSIIKGVLSNKNKIPFTYFSQHVFSGFFYLIKEMFFLLIHL